MSNLEKNIKRINDKLQQLLKNYQFLQKDNQQQKKLIEELKQAKEKNEQQIAAMQQQVNILKAATGQMNADDKKYFEKSINQYIKEIDKCIGILSEWPIPFLPILRSAPLQYCSVPGNIFHKAGRLAPAS